MPELRKCIVKGRPAYFHRWSDTSQIVPPSPMVGGHNGGVISCTLGIIEYEDGHVQECYPSDIKFTNKPMERPEVNLMDKPAYDNAHITIKYGDGRQEEIRKEK